MTKTQRVKVTEYSQETARIKKERDAILDTHKRDLLNVLSNKSLYEKEVVTLKEQSKKLFGDVFQITQQIGELNLALESLNDTIRFKQNLLLELNAEHSEKSGFYRNQYELFEKDQARWNAQIEYYEQCAKDKSVHEDKLVSLKSESRALEVLIVEQNEMLAKQREEIISERAMIEKEKQELISFKGLLDNLSTELHLKQGELEVFIRRLQSYYDQNNINLKILPHFGLTELSQTHGN